MHPCQAGGEVPGTTYRGYLVSGGTKMHINALKLLAVFLAIKTYQGESTLEYSDSDRQHDGQSIYYEPP